jgi:hypothetical protein
MFSGNYNVYVLYLSGRIIYVVYENVLKKKDPLSSSNSNRKDLSEAETQPIL